MQFPKCSTQMQQMQRYETSIDYCPSCRGVWLDRGEIDKITQIHSQVPKTNIITNIIIATESMMTIIIIIMINGEREDSSVTYFTFKTSARIRILYAIKLIFEPI